MYLNFFNLKREPFHISPDPYFFYLGPTHREALAALIYAVKNKKGFVSITGEVGLGKTTVVRTFLSHFKDNHRQKVILIFNTKLNFKNLLKLILLELGFEKQKLIELENNTSDDEGFELEGVGLLYDYLIDRYKRGINVVLILDEAQNLPVDTLEKLRLISNLETEKNKLIQFFLIGQPELDKKLALKDLRQLKQRIELRIKLKKLNKKEIKQYIDFRLKKAGHSGDYIFSKFALKKIKEYSQGIPRKINIICDNALIDGFAQNKKKLGSKVIEEVCKDLYKDENKNRFSKISYTLIFFIIFFISFYFGVQLNDVNSKFNSHVIFSSEEKNSENDYVTTIKSPVSANNNTVNLKDNTITTDEFEQSIYFENNDFTDIPTLNQSPLENATFDFSLIKSLTTSDKIIYLALLDELPFFKNLSKIRQIVLVEMAKDTSINGILTFKKMISALEQQDYNLAARHMVYSNWSKRVGNRTIILSEIMKTNDRNMLLEVLEENSNLKKFTNNLNITPSKNQTHEQQDTAH